MMLECWVKAASLELLMLMMRSSCLLQAGLSRAPEPLMLLMRAVKASVAQQDLCRSDRRFRADKT